MKKLSLYLKKYWWVAVAVISAIVGLIVFGGRGRKKSLKRPQGLREPLPGLREHEDPEEPEDVVVESSPFDRYMEKAKMIDEEIKSDRVRAANGRYK
jgi:hypothetical protein